MIVEGITVVFFAVDYILRLLTAKCAYPRLKECHALRKYMFSFNGIVDMLSFIPYFLPFIFPKGTVAFRMLRIIRKIDKDIHFGVICAKSMDVPENPLS